MEKEFVTYEQALALKELGFNEECFGAFIGKELKIFIFSNDLTGHVNNANLIIGVPTFSQALRWFREKHGVVGYVEPTFDSSKRLPDNEHSYQWIIKLEQRVFIKDGDFDDYEKAESACLDKLIEIVKNNS